MREWRAAVDSWGRRSGVVNGLCCAPPPSLPPSVCTSIPRVPGEEAWRGGWKGREVGMGGRGGDVGSLARASLVQGKVGKVGSKGRLR